MDIVIFADQAQVKKSQSTNGNINLFPIFRNIVITCATPIISIPQTVSPSSATITITGSVPVISNPRTVSPSAANITITGSVPTITNAPASTPILEFSTQPDGAVSGSNFTTQPVVQKLINGSLDTSFTGNVTVSIYSGSGALAGTATVAAVAGAATFTNLKITGIGHHVLQATASGITTGLSGLMSVVRGTTSAMSGLTLNSTAKYITYPNTIAYPTTSSIVAIFRPQAVTVGGRIWDRNGPNASNREVFAYSTSDLLLYIKTRATTSNDFRGTAGMTVGKTYKIAVTHDDSLGSNAGILYVGEVGTPVTAITLSTNTTGSGSFTDPSSSAIRLGADGSGGNNTNADLFGIAYFNRVLTPAEIDEVGDLLCDRVRDYTTRTVPVSGCIGFWRNIDAGGGVDTDFSSGGHNGTITGSPASVNGETVYVPEIFEASVDPSDSSHYWLSSSHARVSFTTTATQVGVGMYRVLAGSTYDNQNAISVYEGSTYKGQILAANTGYNYGTLTLSAGSKTVTLIAGLHSRVGSAGTGNDDVGTTMVAIKFNAAATEITPVTPADSILFLNDSILEGFLTSPVGQRGPLDQLRAYTAGAPEIYAGGYGGHTVYKLAVDSTAITNTVTFIKKFSPTKLVLALSANDYLNNLWSASSMQTAYSNLLDAIITEFPSMPIYACTCPTLASGEGANGSGSTTPNYRTAISNACSGRATVTVIDGPTEVYDGTNNADGLHPNNTGADAIYANLKTFLGL